MLILKIVRVTNSVTMTRLEDFHLDDILIDGKSQQNILIWDVSYKTLTSLKPQIKFD